MCRGRVCERVRCVNENSLQERRWGVVIECMGEGGEVRSVGGEGGEVRSVWVKVVGEG